MSAVLEAPPSVTTTEDELWLRITEKAAALAPDVGRVLEAERLSLMGCGFHGRHAAAALRAEKRPLAAFFDNDPFKQGSVLEQLPVLSLDDYRASEHGIVLITARHVVPVLARQLAERGIAHLSYDAFFVARHLERFREVREAVFTEAQSRIVFDTLLLAMLTGSADGIKEIVSPDQYFHFPAEMRRDDECFVDAGAHDGDSIGAFLDHHGGRFRRIHAFEPTPSTFAALRRNVEALSKRWDFAADDVLIVNAGVGAAPETMVISADPAMPTSNALIAGQEGERVDVVRLDDALAGERVTFLKADVEGMELDMLKGAARTISSQRPKLAISLYHRMEDFLEIPAFIATLSGDYRFRLRHHTASLLETVLYADCGDECMDPTS